MVGHDVCGNSLDSDDGAIEVMNNEHGMAIIEETRLCFTDVGQREDS